MAFMMPVMKNEFDIYKSSRSRKESECSNNSTACRSRKVSETRSECPSLSTSPSNMDHRNYMNRNHSRGFSRTSSRTSQSSLTSPTKTNNCSPPKPANPSGSQGSLNKFHIRLVDKLRKSFRKERSEDRS